MRDLLKLIAVVALIALAATSCSTRKNTAASRNYQAFITRYNIYYNGEEHFKETLKTMEEKYEDNYSQRVYMHPAEAYADPKAPKPSGSFDRSIEKAQKAIQLRSIKKKPAKKSGKGNNEAYKAWMKREEYNPFIHNAWLMMGRSQYFKGDFAGAAATFSYIDKHFSWLPEVNTESRLWQARSYCGMDWLFEAETILKRIKPDELTNKELKGLYYFTYADYYVKSNDYEKAIPMLVEAVKYAKGPQKVRLNFLLGQLYSAQGMKKQAYEAFKKVSGSSGASYRTQFNARIKQSEVYEGANIEPEVKALLRMTRYDRNKEYLDQIYYAVGNLYLSRRDTTKAIDNYKLAVEKSTRSGYDKALALITLGQLYFDRHEYDLAQPCYAEAVPQLPANFPEYALLKRRSDVLDELAVYAGNVTLQDSLLRLAAMTPEQQLAVANKLIEELKKKEKEEQEEARRQEYLAQQEGKNTLNNESKAPQTFNMSGDNSWYFYNTATRNAGKTEFQRRWGSRKLEDDWRRRNKSTFNTSDFAPADEDEDEDKLADGEAAEDSVASSPRANDPHFPEYYLKQIPKTEAEIATSNDVIQEGLFNMGLILKDKLDDYKAATSEWDRLLIRYPDNIYRLDVYYNMYLMLARQGKMAEAERWRQLILGDFPESKEGMALLDPDFIQNLKSMDAETERLYAETLDDYLANRNGEVHKAYDKMQSTYPMSKIMPKFMFLHALAYVTEEQPDKFGDVLKDLLQKYPQTDITPLASAYLKGLAQGRELNASAGGNMRGMIWDIKLSGDSASVAGGDQPLKLKLDPDAQHLLVLVYPTDSVATNQLLYDIARHNFTTFVVRDYDLELMRFDRLGMLLIKGFDNLAEVNHYLHLLADDTTLTLSEAVRPVAIGQDDFDTLLKQGRSFDEYFQALSKRDDEKAEEAAEDPDAPDEPDEGNEGDEGEVPDNADNSEAPDNPDTPDDGNNPETPAETPASPEQ